MIVVAILAMATLVLIAISAVLVAIPPIPSEIMDFVSMALEYFRQGLGFFLTFVQPAPVKMMLAISITLHAVYSAYRLVMWVATKIPMLGVSDG